MPGLANRCTSMPGQPRALVCPDRGVTPGISALCPVSPGVSDWARGRAGMQESVTRERSTQRDTLLNRASVTLRIMVVRFRPGIVFKVYIIAQRFLVVCSTTRSIMPSRSWRDTGHKALCPMSLLLDEMPRFSCRPLAASKRSSAKLVNTTKAATDTIKCT